MTINCDGPMCWRDKVKTYNAPKENTDMSDVGNNLHQTADWDLAEDVRDHGASAEAVRMCEVEAMAAVARREFEDASGLAVPVTGTPTPKSTEMRRFASGAIRDTNTDKMDYRGFISERADRLFAEYMHVHRHLADGSMRASDNWKKGIPIEAYEESLYRHFKEFFARIEEIRAGTLEGVTNITDRAELMTDVAQAIRFNLQGWVHEVSKALDEIIVTGRFEDFPSNPIAKVHGDFGELEEPKIR